MVEGMSENQSPVSGSIWFHGKKPEGGCMVPPLSARAEEIAKSREELLGLLRDLPESDYELSLTDLVEKGSVDSVDEAPEKNSAEEKTNQKPMAKQRSKRLRRSSSTGDGVLLNMYMPTSLTRSGNGSRSSSSSSQRASIDGNKRDIEDSAFIGCWSAILYKGRGKSRRT